MTITTYVHTYVHSCTKCATLELVLLGSVTSGAHLDVELGEVGLSSGFVNGELLVVPARGYRESKGPHKVQKDTKHVNTLHMHKGVMCTAWR